ncbi:response regulator transcription factor [Sphingobacterium corticibacter]|uniref:DNA-binding response regulator n=1 Tax=Sphingobacterium corticibacter TaxID=2171749 RepID=A0A2T8HL80_9SPHI|nr:response regulator transcription factor [Sphingobacterium corticibacter]PVH26150.1 DNA-binding response regulator [Sphingobacterium corticibacter]
MKTRILYVEDESDLGNVTKQYLEMMGFDVYWALDGTSALKAYGQEQYDISIIDIQLPDTDGFALAKQIGQINEQAQFLFLTARNMKEDKIQGLQLGAFDYVTKPFDVDELVLRIRNFVNRQMRFANSAREHTKNEIFIDDVKLDLKLLSLSIGDSFTTTLTLRELELLTFLYKQRNQIVKREEILLHIWGDNDYFLGRSLDVFISRLRKVLSKSNSVKIENVYGVGFKLVSPR